MTPLRRLLAAADAAMNRLYGWRGNPLYQSGTIVALLLVVLLVTGVWLLLFYRVGAPWASVEGLTANRWTGNWVRGLHRYASAAAVLAAMLHAMRMIAQRRTWGPRVLAWISGLVLLAVLLVSGWTGFVMVWDGFGRELAMEGARWLDALPVLSEPVARTFTGPEQPPPAFFFINLFLHVALPLGMGLLLWLHVSRTARPILLPPRALAWGIVGALTAVAVLWPLDLAPEGDPLRLSGRVPVDWWYAFWLPVTRRMEPGAVWALGLAVAALVLGVPWLTRPRPSRRPKPSWVDPQLCTGCTQCALDCPWEAIALVPRAAERSEVVARVNPNACVSCGICAGSCAPMGVGPPGRTGRAQLQAVKSFRRGAGPGPGVVVIACTRGAGVFSARFQAEGTPVYPVDCAGNLHTSAVEFLLRGGAAGVLVLACPPRDCEGREGPKWLMERLFHGREAELQPRVDRRRLRVCWVGAGEFAAARRGLEALRRDLAVLPAPAADPDAEPDTECVPAGAGGEAP